MMSCQNSSKLCLKMWLGCMKRLSPKKNIIKCYKMENSRFLIMSGWRKRSFRGKHTYSLSQPKSHQRKKCGRNCLWKRKLSWTRWRILLEKESMSRCSPGKAKILDTFGFLAMMLSTRIAVDQGKAWFFSNQSMSTLSILSYLSWS